MADASRCGVCGLLHPLVTVCPYVQEQEVREEFVSDGRRRRLVTRVIRTRYFPRAAVAAASLAAPEDDAEEDPEQTEAEAQP